MKWGAQQDRALSAVDKWVKDPDAPQVFRLFGYAGTGKTTMAKHLAEGVEGGVVFAAYTGKAAHVLQTKGCPGAQTIHSLIYITNEKSKKRLVELEAQLVGLLNEQHESPSHNIAEKIKDVREQLDIERQGNAQPFFSKNVDSDLRRVRLLVIDECSMVDGAMGEDVLSFGKKVLVLGDPAQLPPTHGAGFFTEGVKPDIMLDEIHRQASDNPIIRMATKIRNEEFLKPGEDYGESQVIWDTDMQRDMVTGADQLIVGRNATRHSWNRRMRQLAGRVMDIPEPGDKLVCLRNNKELGLLNGALFTAIAAEQMASDRVLLRVRPETNPEHSLECEAHSQYFEGKGDEIPWWEKKEAEEFDYGYALTCHKSQGSQWNNVLVKDESWCFRKDRFRWLYTAVTRAAEKVTVVREKRN